MAPSMVGRNRGVSSLLTADMKNATDRELIKFHIRIHHENLHEIFLKMKLFP
jgi:hypothetical protein